MTRPRLVAGIFALQFVVLAIVLVFVLGRDDDPAPAAVAAPAVPTATAHRFDAPRAMRLIRTQLDVGQRPAGSPQLRELATRLRALLPAGRFEDLPGHPGLRNVVGELPGREPAIVLGAHYDTEVAPEGFVGANDSASGTAVLIEVARALRRIDRPAGAPAIRFVLFDGEEEPAPTDDFYRDALRGSKAYVARFSKRTGSMLLLDYVGNKGLRLPREGTSSAPLWNRVRRAAQTVGVARVFPDEAGVPIIDDHTPFLRAGIPAVDFIDWDYRYRDTLQDTYDKLSERSIDAVGETVVEVLRTWR